MNIHTRFILHLLGRLILTGFLLLLSILIIFLFIAFLTMNSAIEKTSPPQKDSIFPTGSRSRMAKQPSINIYKKFFKSKRAG
ncbi:hypothetical protein ACPJHQ_07980 [Rossellomorea sp. H39__3]